MMMLPLSTLRSFAASEAGNASPPIRTVLSKRNASLVASSAISMPAIEGVHCRCVTLCDRISAGIEYLPSRGSGALVVASRSASRYVKFSRTMSALTPKSIKQATSSMSFALSLSIMSRQLSGVPNKPLVSK